MRQDAGYNFASFIVFETSSTIFEILQETP
jgi:hypothetical protein